MERSISNYKKILASGTVTSPHCGFIHNSKILITITSTSSWYYYTIYSITCGLVGDLAELCSRCEWQWLSCIGNWTTIMLSDEFGAKSCRSLYSSKCIGSGTTNAVTHRLTMKICLFDRDLVLGRTVAAPLVTVTDNNNSRPLNWSLSSRTLRLMVSTWSANTSQ